MDIHELARRSGVSPATVSRALNGRPEVSAATRERVRAIAEDLGYAPNASARALARRRSGLVGLLWDTDYRSGGQQHPFLQDLLVGLKHALSEHGQGLILLPITDEATGYVGMVRANDLEGVVLMGLDPATPQVRALTGSGIGCVGIDLALDGDRVRTVVSDNRAGAATAVRHLHALGHRRIATITGPLDMPPAADRLAGYRAALRELRLPYRRDYVVSGDFFPASGEAGMRRLLGRPEPPTAVFVAGDAMAIAAAGAAADLGRPVPDDVAVVGFDDIEAAALVRPALTTIAQDFKRFGSEAVRVLAELSTEGPAAPVVLPTRLVVRQSCGASRREHA